MGLLEKYRVFRQKRLEKAIVQNFKLVKNPKAIKEDRVAAIEFFKGLSDCESAAPHLLARFDYSLEHGINDTREKESVMEGLLAFKEAALPFIEKHLMGTDRIAWPIKAYKALASERQVVATLEACLDYGDVDFDQQRVDKNYDILCYLVDYKLPAEMVPKLCHFLTAHDERLRFAAVEALLEQGQESLAPKLEGFLYDPSAENTRIRQVVAVGFHKLGWKVSQPEKSELLPRGFLLGSEGRLEAKP